MGLRPSTPPQRNFDTDPPLRSLQTLGHNGVDSNTQNHQFSRRYNSEYGGDNDSNSQHTFEQNREFNDTESLQNNDRLLDERLHRNVQHLNGGRSFSPPDQILISGKTYNSVTPLNC